MASSAPAPKPTDPLSLGQRRDRPGEAVSLPVSALLRHVMALGSSGSGETVFCKVLVEEVLLFSADGGIRFATELHNHASEIANLGGLAKTLELRPGDLTFDEEEWTARLPAAPVRKRVHEAFSVRAGAVAPVFFPLWKLLLRRGGGDSFRVETVDALIGMSVDWPVGDT